MEVSLFSSKDLLEDLKSKLKASLTPRNVALASACLLGVHLGMNYYLNSWGKDKLGYFTSAMDVVDGCDLRGEVMIVTGCSRSIGYETVRALYSKGATVVMACRSLDKAQLAKARIEASTKTRDGALECMELDLADLASVRAFVQQFEQTHERLHVLINNAGVCGMRQMERTTQDVESHFGVNHLGHYYLARLLTPLLQSSAPSRVVSVASTDQSKAPDVDEWLSKMEAGACGPLQADYSPYANYAFSKACNVLFAREFHRRHSKSAHSDKTKVAAVSVHPGVFASDMDESLNAVTRWLRRHGPWYKDVERAAATTTMCAVMDDSEMFGGFFADCALHNDKLRDDIRDDEREIAKRLWKLSEVIITGLGYGMSTASVRMSTIEMADLAKH